MKIGLISSEFPPERGGIQTYAWEYARELARRGHEVTVFTQPHPEGETETTDFRIVPELRLRRRHDSVLFARHRVDLWHALNAAYAWVALEAPRVFLTVHGNDFLWPYLPVGRLDLRERFHLPCGSSLDRWLGERLTGTLVRRSVPRCTHIFTNSRYSESRFLAMHPACHGRTSPAMVGVAEAFSRRERPTRRAGRTRLVTVCRLAEPHKNVDLVLRALASLKDAHDFEYTVIGDGYLRAEYERLVDDLGLRDRVTFTGFIEQDRLLDHLLASDLFILPTTSTPTAYEGFGIVYLEAMACGCPALAARIGGAVEAVSEGVSGLLLDEVNPASIGAAVASVISGEVRFDSRQCVEFARGFSWARVVDHCLGHYERSLLPRS